MEGERVVGYMVRPVFGAESGCDVMDNAGGGVRIERNGFLRESV